MLRHIWDFLFTRKSWKVIEQHPMTYENTGLRIGTIYVLQDQFGNIKKKSISA